MAALKAFLDRTRRSHPQKSRLIDANPEEFARMLPALFAATEEEMSNAEDDGEEEDVAAEEDEGSDEDNDASDGERAAAQALARRTEEPRLVYDRSHGSGYVFPHNGRDWNGESWVPRHAARAAAKAAKSATSTAVPAAKPAAKPVAKPAAKSAVAKPASNAATTAKPVGKRQSAKAASVAQLSADEPSGTRVGVQHRLGQVKTPARNARRCRRALAAHRRLGPRRSPPQSSASRPTYSYGYACLSVACALWLCACLCGGDPVSGQVDQSSPRPALNEGNKNDRL